MWTEAQQQAFAERGYFIASDAVSPDMVEELRQAARRVKARIRAGKLDLYTDYRGEDQPYHISGLIAPQYGEPIFAQYLASEPLLAYVQAQIGHELRFGSLSMFTNPHDQVFNVPWHRDDGLVFDKDEATELAYLQEPRTECRWELALADDSALGRNSGQSKALPHPAGMGGHEQQPGRGLARGRDDSLAGRGNRFLERQHHSPGLPPAGSRAADLGRGL